jgi:hypothetical protein
VGDGLGRLVLGDGDVALVDGSFEAPPAAAPERGGDGCKGGNAAQRLAGHAAQHRRRPVHGARAGEDAR